MVSNNIKKGIFTISIDFEFAWGYFDQELSEGHKEDIKKEVQITKRLILLFEKYNIPVTWAIVSKLLEKGKDTKMDVIWSDTENLIPLIKNSSAHHEIASHSYSHLIYGDKSTTHSIAQSDIIKAKEIHEKNRLDFNSFVFPRNSEGYHKDLVDAGIKSFRSHKKSWYSFLPKSIQRAFNMLSYLFPVVVSESTFMHPSGLVAIPGGMLILGRNGLRKIIPPSLLVKKAKRSLREISNSKEVFHLWFHPSNFTYETETQFAILEEIIKEADLFRNDGKINIMTMNQIETEFQKNNNLPNNKGVTSHHLNAGVFANRYKIFDKNPYENAFAYDRKRLFQFLYDFSQKNLRQGSRVLEVGSGTGYFLNSLKQKGYDVVGVEPAAAMKESALSQYPDLKIYEAGIEKLPFPDQTFDAVFAIEVFRYLSKEDQEKGYKECLRVLKPGGNLIATLVNKYALDGFYIKYKFFALLEKLNIKELPNYCSFMTPSYLEKFLTTKLNISANSINTYGTLFAPLRLVYKVSKKVGEKTAKKLEKFDESLATKKWHKKFAGYLILIIKK